MLQVSEKRWCDNERGTLEDITNVSTKHSLFPVFIFLFILEMKYIAFFFYLISQLRYMRTYYLIIDILPGFTGKMRSRMILRNFAFIVTSEIDSEWV